MIPRTAILPVAAVAVSTAGLALALLTPPDRVQGQLVRLMYVHVPAAWVGNLGFGLTFDGGLVWLWRRQPWADRLAAASAEVGVFFTGLATVLGSVWGKAVWGVWWAWDARLVTTLLLFFVYLGYLALRRAVLDPVARAGRSAVFGTMAFLLVPVVHLSVVWWRTLHQPPTVLRGGDPSIDHSMLAALLVNLVAFTLVFALLTRTRVRIAEAEDGGVRCGGPALPGLAGAAIDAPALRRLRSDV